MLQATSGWRSKTILRLSAQLAQWAALHKRTADLKPSPPTTVEGKAPPNPPVVFLCRRPRVCWTCGSQPEILPCSGAIQQEGPCRLEVLHRNPLQWDACFLCFLLEDTRHKLCVANGSAKDDNTLTVIGEVWVAPPHHSTRVNFLGCFLENFNTFWRTPLWFPDHCLPEVKCDLEGAKARLVVLALEDGRWSVEESPRTVEPRVLQRRMEQAWSLRWCSILSCAATRSLPCLCFDGTIAGHAGV